MDANMKQNFQYSYSAAQQAEIRRIREKYVSPQENKLERLRRLDRVATRKGSVLALILGILGSLILGLGMCCTMLWAETLFLPGAVIGAVGLAAICLAYPLYQRVTRKDREKYAGQILDLTDELLQ